MPVAPITPDPGAEGWGRPTPGPPSSMPPDADPDGVYRPAAVGGHRTARWFILVGVALVLLVAPLAVPMNDADDTGRYLLNDAAADTLTTWEASPLDLASLDQRCVATGEALLPGTLEAECTSGYGTGPVDLDIVSMAGVEDAPLSAGRGLRAILASDVSDVPFRPASAEDVLHPSLSARTGEFLMSPVIELSSPFADLPDLPDLREPGMPGETQPVQYGDIPPEVPETAETPGTSPGVYTVAASFTIDGPDGVLYTVAVTGADEASVTVTARQLWGAVRAA